jgi:hypothetical protein
MNIRAIYEFGRLDRVLLASFVRGDSEIPCRPSVAISYSLTDILPCPRHLTCSSPSAVDFNSLNFYTFKKCVWQCAKRNYSWYFMQVMDRLPQSVSAYIAHIICLPATINFRNTRHWGFFSTLLHCCFCGMDLLHCKYYGIVAEDGLIHGRSCHSDYRLCPRKRLRFRVWGGVWIELFLPCVVELCVS